MLKWTVQQRRKSAADIGDVLLLGFLAQAPTGCSDVDGVPARPQPQLRKRGPMRQAAVSSAEPIAQGLCEQAPQLASRLSGLDATRPRSASPRFNSANTVEGSPRCDSGTAATAVRSLQVVRRCSQLTPSSAEVKDGEPSASDLSAARRRFSLTPTVYRRAAAAAREAAAAAAAPANVVRSLSERAPSPRVTAERQRLSATAGTCSLANLSTHQTADPDAAATTAARGAVAPSRGEPELMCVATATSATPKVAKLRRLRPPLQCRRNCAPPASSNEGAAAERGETRRAATPDSGVGVVLSEGESVPSDEDAADACGCHPFFTADAHPLRHPAIRRGSTCRGAPDDYIDADFRIQRSTSDSAAAAQLRAAEGLSSCSIGRCNSSPRLGDVRDRRDICDVLVASASLRRPCITFTPAVVPSDDSDAADAAEAGHRRGSLSSGLTVVITTDTPDQLPLGIPRCLTADASLGRPRALARRRLSDCGRADREGGGELARSTGGHVSGHQAFQPLSWVQQRNLHHLTAHDWREVTI